MKQLTEHVFRDPAGHVTWRGPFKVPAEAQNWRHFALHEMAEALERAQEQLTIIHAVLGLEISQEGCD